MIIKDLGTVTGKMLVMGGIYSNLQALNAFLAQPDAHDVAADHIICTGDIVAYCADARACAEHVRDLGIVTIAGNCERQIAAGADDCGCGFENAPTCSLLSRGWYAHALDQTTVGLRHWMADLPDWITFIHRDKRYVVVHGGASHISKFVWPTATDANIRAELALINQEMGRVDCVLASHTGIVMDRTVDGVRWYNSGALGMPAHAGKQTTSYAVIDDDIETHDLVYDAQAAHDAMVAVGLVQGYHDSLLSGYWPSEESLPPELHR